MISVTPRDYNGLHKLQNRQTPILALKVMKLRDSGFATDLEDSAQYSADSVTDYDGLRYKWSCRTCYILDSLRVMDSTTTKSAEAVPTLSVILPKSHYFQQTLVTLFA